MSKLQMVEGSILVSKPTLLRLVASCLPKRPTPDVTLYEVGYEQAKKEMAQLLQREFKIDIGLNPAQQLMQELKK